MKSMTLDVAYDISIRDYYRRTPCIKRWPRYYVQVVRIKLYFLFWNVIYYIVYRGSIYKPIKPTMHYLRYPYNFNASNNYILEKDLVR